MKILVFSDSHGGYKSIENAIKLHKAEADLVIFLGDGARDMDLIQEKYPHLTIFKLRGNCDFMCDSPDSSILDLDGVRILLTHGHKYNVKSGLGTILYAGMEGEVDAIFFGHTHQELDTTVDANGKTIRLFNPGSIGMGRTYGVVNIVNGVLITNIASAEPK